MTEGTLRDYDAARRAEMATVVAGLLGLPSRAVSVTIIAGSVIATYTIEALSEAHATSLSMALRSQTSNVTHASQLLGVPVIASPTVQILQVSTPFPSLPPPSPLPASPSPSPPISASPSPLSMYPLTPAPVAPLPALPLPESSALERSDDEEQAALEAIIVPAVLGLVVSCGLCCLLVRRVVNNARRHEQQAEPTRSYFNATSGGEQPLSTFGQPDLDAHRSMPSPRMASIFGATPSSVSVWSRPPRPEALDSKSRTLSRSVSMPSGGPSLLSLSLRERPPIIEYATEAQANSDAGRPIGRALSYPHTPAPPSSHDATPGPSFHSHHGRPAPSISHGGGACEAQVNRGQEGLHVRSVEQNVEAANTQVTRIESTRADGSILSTPSSTQSLLLSPEAGAALSALASTLSSLATSPSPLEPSVVSDSRAMHELIATPNYMATPPGQPSRLQSAPVAAQAAASIGTTPLQWMPADATALPARTAVPIDRLDWTVIWHDYAPATFNHPAVCTSCLTYSHFACVRWLSRPVPLEVAICLP